MSRMIASTYSWLSLVGLVSSKRRLLCPPTYCAMPRGAAGVAAEVGLRLRQVQRRTGRRITWETVRSQARLYAERRAGTPLEWLWRMTRARYDAMVANGALEEDEPIELLDGLLIVREPEGGRHAVIVGRVRRALEAAFGQGCYVREDKPFALDDMSEPE